MVDDDPIFMSSMSRFCSLFGKTLSASSGKSAIALLDKTKPDVILLDLSMPDVSGLTVLKKIRQDTSLSDTVVIVVTAFGDKDNHLQSIRDGADHFVTKPVDFDLLRAQIEAILERRKANINLVSPLYKFKSLFGMLAEAVMLIDDSGRILFANQYALNLFGYSEVGLVGQNLSILIPSESRDSHQKHFTNSKNSDVKIDHLKLVGMPRLVSGMTKTGRRLQLDVNITQFTSGNTTEYIAVIRDIKQTNLAEQALIRQAMYDELTGLNTLAAFDVDYKSLVNTESNLGTLLMLIVDLDNFHEMNLFYGHSSCDLILKELSTHIASLSISNNLQAYRLMADRFLVTTLVNSDSSLDELVLVLKKQLAVSIKTVASQTRMPITATIVHQETQLNLLSDESPLHQLELSLISSKKRERFYHEIRGDSDDNKSISMSRLSQSMLRGLIPFNISVFYQPKVNKNKSVVSFEALLRWNNDDFKDLTVLDFIKVAESNRMIIQIGQIVIENVFRFLSSSEPQSRIPVSINLSIAQLLDPELIGRLNILLKEHNIAPELITFEITETLIARDIGIISDVLNEMTQMKFNFSVDDFGTGQSNLRYIHRLPVGELKLDKSFVDDVLSSSSKYVMVDAIVMLGKMMELKVVAEGVETEEQFKYLQRIGCDEFQGYYFSKPVSETEAHSILTSR